MIIISDYTLSCNENSNIFIESSDTCLCPCCQAPLDHRDYRLRIMKLEGGEKKLLRVERRKCTNGGCRKIHTVLPDCIVPYKHYANEIIVGVLDEVITPDDADTEDYPCEETMHRWKHWLMVNYLRIEGYLKSIGHRLLELEKGLLVSNEKETQVCHFQIFPGNLKKYLPTKAVYMVS